MDIEVLLMNADLEEVTGTPDGAMARNTLLPERSETCDL